MEESPMNDAPRHPNDLVTVEVTEDDAGKRLDVFLVDRVPNMSRAKAKALTGSGDVRIDGSRARKGARVREGQQVSLQRLPRPNDFEPLPDASMDLRIVHEDDQLVVIDKAAPMPCHPLAPDELGTVVNGLVARYPEMRGVGHRRREAGLLHRLDNGTSGLLLAARTTQAFGVVAEALAAGAVDKRYQALCEGQVHAPAFIDWPIAHHHDARRMLVCERPDEADRLSARAASTEVLESKEVRNLSFVVVRARTARRHQVRVHLAALGHPLAGDDLYGGPSIPGLHRHFLHASRIQLIHPAGNELELSAPLPEDLQRVLQSYDIHE